MIVTSKHRGKKGNWSVEMSKAPYSKPYNLMSYHPSLKKSIQKPNNHNILRFPDHVKYFYR